MEKQIIALYLQQKQFWKSHHCKFVTLSISENFFQNAVKERFLSSTTYDAKNRKKIKFQKHHDEKLNHVIKTFGGLKVSFVKNDIYLVEILFADLAVDNRITTLQSKPTNL